MRDKVPKNAIAVYDLLNLINKSRNENNDVLIAKKLLEHRYDLDRYSLDKLSEKIYFSQSALSRFFKKMGYSSYSDFKNNIMFSNYYIEQDNRSDNYASYETILTDIKNTVFSCLSYIDDVDKYHVERIVSKLKSAKTIYFMGSELSMAITHLLQVGLISMGKEAYTIFDFHFQNELLQRIDNDTLIVVISLEQRAYTMIKNSLFNCNNNHCYKMLWTIDSHHENMEMFDDYINIGGKTETNMGYWELMYFILLIYRLVLNGE